MRLPNAIYNTIKPVFAHHGAWHVARLPQNAQMRGPGTSFPTLRGLDQAGSGEQFLRFHRDMVRVFKWLLANTPSPGYTYTPWNRLPSWLAAEFNSRNPGRLAESYREIDRLVRQGTADDLGNFIEATLLSAHRARNIHNSAHGVISFIEESTYGANHPRLRDAEMNDPMTAPHNRHFWGLHGWLDDVLARWQQEHGEVVDQSPLDPEHSDHGHHEPPNRDLDEADPHHSARQRFESLTGGASQEEASRHFKERIFVPEW